MQLAFIELPEGSLVEATSIVGFLPRTTSEYDDSVNGTVLLLSSGHTVETDETIERILHQINEVSAKMAGQ